MKCDSVNFNETLSKNVTFNRIGIFRKMAVLLSKWDKFCINTVKCVLILFRVGNGSELVRGNLNIIHKESLRINDGLG